MDHSSAKEKTNQEMRNMFNEWMNNKKFQERIYERWHKKNSYVQLDTHNQSISDISHERTKNAVGNNVA